MKHEAVEFKVKPDNRYSNSKYGLGVVALIVLEGVILWQALQEIANFFH